MRKEFKITEFENDGFLHSRVKGVNCNFKKKSFIIDLHAADLKNGEYITTCTITITDWWELQVIEKGQKVHKEYLIDEIPTDIDQIFKYEYDGNVLMLKACGSLEIDSVIYYKFTKPNIHITGEYDPD